MNRILPVLFLTVSVAAAGCAAQSSMPVKAQAQAQAIALPRRGPQVRDAGHFIAEYPVSGQVYGLLRAADGNIWFTEIFADLIGRITPAGQVTEFQVPVRGLVRQMVAGTNGHLWFTLARTASGGYLGEVALDGSMILHHIPTPGPRGIALGPDGNMWFLDDSNYVGRYNADGTVSAFPIPTSGSSSRGITAGPDGNLWFTEFGAQQVGKITTSGAFNEYPAGGSPIGPPFVVNGRLWLTDAENELSLVNISGRARTIQLPDAPGGLLQENGGGNVWVTLQTLNEIDLINPDGKALARYPVPTAGANPVALAYGSDGNLWFSEPLAPVPSIGVLRP